MQHDNDNIIPQQQQQPNPVLPSELLLSGSSSSTLLLNQVGSTTSFEEASSGATKTTAEKRRKSSYLPINTSRRRRRQISTTTISSHDNITPIISIPLVSYHVQRERLIRRRKLLVEAQQYQYQGYSNNNSLNNNNNNLNSSNTSSSKNRKRRKLQEQQQEQDIVELPTASLFQGYGTHYVDLWCGTPVPQRQTVIVDTGSDVTGFPCSGCQRCGAKSYHTDPLYDIYASETFSKVTNCNECLRGKCKNKNYKKKLRGSTDTTNGLCELEASYREGSGWEAHEVRDVCYLGGLHNEAVRLQPPPPAASSEEEDDKDGLDPKNAARYKFPLQFACQTSVSGAFRTQLADGILGMQPSKASLWRQVSEYYYQKTTAASSSSSMAEHNNNNANNDLDAGAAAGALLRDTKSNIDYNAGANTSSKFFPMKDPSFSLCYAFGDESKVRRGARAGLFTLGGVDPRISTTTMVYSRFGMKNQHSKYFPVVMRKVYLQPGEDTGSSSSSTSSSYSNTRKGRTPIQLDISEDDLNEYEVTIDSGATDTYFTERLIKPFQRVWRELVGVEFNNKRHYVMTKEQIRSLPTILIQLKGEYAYNSIVLEQEERAVTAANNDTTTTTTMSSSSSLSMLARDIDPDHPYDVIVPLKPEHYYECSPKHDNLCYPRFHFDHGHDSALGASIMLGKTIFFDSSNKRIGWAESSCDYDAIIDDHITNKIKNKKATTSSAYKQQREIPQKADAHSSGEGSLLLADASQSSASTLDVDNNEGNNNNSHQDAVEVPAGQFVSSNAITISNEDAGINNVAPRLHSSAPELNVLTGSSGTAHWFPPQQGFSLLAFSLFLLFGFLYASLRQRRRKRWDRSLSANVMNSCLCRWVLRSRGDGVGVGVGAPVKMALSDDNNNINIDAMYDDDEDESTALISSDGVIEDSEHSTTETPEENGILSSWAGKNRQLSFRGGGGSSNRS